MTALSVGQIQGLFPSNEIVIDPNTKLTIEGILRISTIQNSSGITTFSSTAQGSITLLGSLTTTQSITSSTSTPSRLVIAIWSTSNRPINPVTGTFGYNTTIESIEVYNGSTWEKISGI